MSTNAFDFSDAVEIDMEVKDPIFFNSRYSLPNAEAIPYYHEATFDLAELGFEEGVVWIRTYVQDEDHDEPTEMPTSKTQFIFLSHFAFFTN